MGNRQGALEGLVITPAFWRQRRVLVTGHTGFKGAWLSLWLQQLGAEVTGLALEPEAAGSLFVDARVETGMRSVIADIRTPGAVAEVVADANPEIVIHMAAQSLVKAGYREPLDTFDVNVMGTARVLDACRQSSVRAVVSVTSDKCYHNREWAWGYRETEALGGRDPYSASKACAEHVTTAYRESFFADGGPAVASARAGNVIGGGDWAADRLVPDIVRAWLAGQTVPIRNPLAVRPWQHVLEPLAAYLALAQALVERPDTAKGAWNFGPSDTDVRRVEQVASQLCGLLGDGARWEQDSGAHPHEAHLLRLDSSLARQQLGVVSRMPLDTAIQSIADWAKAYRGKADMRAVTIEQIQAFEAMEQHD